MRIKMLESSAKIKVCVNLEALGKSFMHKIKNRGPKIDP